MTVIQKRTMWREEARRYRKAHLKEIREYQRSYHRTWTVANKSKVRTYQQAWFRKNRKRMAKYQHDYWIRVIKPARHKQALEKAEAKLLRRVEDMYSKAAVAESNRT